MTRALRLEYPGAWWHVTNRGVEQRDIFLDDHDRRVFLDLLGEVVPRFRWVMHAYVLMTNHFHLLLETLEPTLSRGMKKVGEDYAEHFNQRYRRVGHLFQGRFKSYLIDSEAYLLTVARYVVLNPVRAGMVDAALHYAWSSARATAGLSASPRWLTTGSVLDRLDKDGVRARLAYRAFVTDASKASERPWDQLVGGLYLGDDEFMERVRARIDERGRSSEHPAGQRMVRCADVEDVRGAVSEVMGSTICKSGSRDARMVFAAVAAGAGLPLGDIARALRIGSTGVSYLARRASMRAASDPSFAALLDCARAQIRNCRLQM